MEYSFLKPIQIGKQTIKNRVMYLAMAKMFSGFDGTVSERDIAYIASVADGGTGLIVPGAMIVDPDWPSAIPLQMAIYDDRFLPGLTKLAEAGHRNGAKILFQLWHPGEVNYSGVKPPTVNDLTVEQIHGIQKKFASAAERAMKAGADGIEFQMCHTYLADQFLTSAFNHRTDEYGADTVENAARFSVETLKMIREVIGPDKILAVKLQSTDCVEGGMTPERAAEIAPLVQAAGADLISVSGGGSLTDITGMSGDGTRKEGWKVPAAALVKSKVTIPVCATGSIRHPSYADQIIRDGSCDMIGMGRGIYAEREWVNKCSEGREKELRYCISCMNCWNTELASDQSGCSVNPFAGREFMKKPLVKDGNGRVVVIAGAGPAGLEAAVTLKQRGFEPIVFEKSSEIGGSINLAKMPPNKYKMGWELQYYRNMIDLLHIDVRCGVETTKEQIEALNPYAVLIATGSKVNNLRLKGFDQAEVLQSHDILAEHQKFSGKKIALIGGGLVGIETALYLKEQGNEVTVVDFAPAPSLNQLDIMHFTMEGALEYGHMVHEGIHMYYSHAVDEYSDGALRITSRADGQKVTISADMIVLAAGQKSDAHLYDELKADGVKNVYKIGDANVSSKVVKAVQAGSKFAYALK